jgi:Cof subfamily protein (haloacid dehalogenase superfamily)
MARFDKDTTLFISDLDGTLLDKSARITPYTADVINRALAAGYRFTLATARTHRTAKPVTGALDITLPMALLNGVLVYDHIRGENLQINGLDDAMASRIREIADERGLPLIMYEIVGGEMTATRRGDSRNGENPLLARVFRDDMPGSFDDVTPAGGGDAIYFTFAGARDAMAPLYERLRTLPELDAVMSRDDYSGDGWFVECFSDKASKYAGAAFLREKYGFKTLVGFGDNVNDLPLFRACDYSCAVGNAKPQAAEAADEVIGMNCEDGVARWIEQNVL